MSLKPILYAEDEEDDAYFLKRAFKRVDISHPLIVVSDGEGAIDYLEGRGRYSSRDDNPLPCLVLVDLNMPKKSGIDVLKWIRHEPLFFKIPVIILTSSLQDADIHRAYTEGANAYFAKPPNPDQLVIMAEAVKNFVDSQKSLLENCGNLFEDYRQRANSIK